MNKEAKNEGEKEKQTNLESFLKKYPTFSFNGD